METRQEVKNLKGHFRPLSWPPKCEYSGAAMQTKQHSHLAPEWADAKAIRTLYGICKSSKAEFPARSLARTAVTHSRMWMGPECRLSVRTQSTARPTRPDSLAADLLQQHIREAAARPHYRASWTVTFRDALYKVIFFGSDSSCVTGPMFSPLLSSSV